MKEFIKQLSNRALLREELILWEFPDVVDPKFHDWFISNCECFNEIINNQNNDQYEALTSSCFKNSQDFSLKNKGAKYYEGIIRGAKFNSNTHHGFNLIDNKILDITRFKFPENFNELRDKEFYYCGVYIPNDFIKKQLNIKGKSQHFPLLYEYFLDSRI